MKKTIIKSQKLNDVCYDIRGPVMQKAKQMEDEGQEIIKLNIGNLAAFNFAPPEDIVHDMASQISAAAGYTDAKGLLAPRKAIMHYAQEKQIQGVTIEDIYIGNGVSELIMMAMSALLNEGDEVLVPAPDYPLWTAAVSLSSGKPVHYICDESAGWTPSMGDIRSKINKRTKAIVIINPNNPTGALYSRDVLQEILNIAREFDLIVYADEIYDKTLYDGEQHISIASLAEDVMCVTFNGLSKNYRSCGYRAGWMILSGDQSNAHDYIEGLNMLASMRLCSNVLGQFAIQTALSGSHGIDDLVAPDGRLCKQRDLAYDILSQIPGVSVVKPKAALYMFPKLDTNWYPIQDDQVFIQELLEEQKVLLVQGTGFNWHLPDHFRLVFLPNEDELMDALNRITVFLENYRRKHKTGEFAESQNASLIA